MKLIQIARSWFDFIQGNQFTKTLMSKRLAICDECEHKVLINPVGRVIMKVIDNDPDAVYQCGQCGCPLMGKTAGPLNECPLGKWKSNQVQSYF